MPTPETLWLMFLELRADAIRRNMPDLALAYGQSAMIYGVTIIGKQLKSKYQMKE